MFYLSLYCIQTQLGLDFYYTETASTLVNTTFFVLFLCLHSSVSFKIYLECSYGTVFVILLVSIRLLIDQRL